MAREVETRSPEATRSLGRTIGATLRAGDVLLLEGELGAGKTTFVKGIADASGVQTMVRSPTFALMHRYRGEPDLVHIDLYRETEAVALEDLDPEGQLEDAITVVEWPRDIAAQVWEDAPCIHIEHVDETTRRIRLP